MARRAGQLRLSSAHPRHRQRTNFHLPGTTPGQLAPHPCGLEAPQSLVARPKAIRARLRPGRRRHKSGLQDLLGNRFGSRQHRCFQRDRVSSGPRPFGSPTLSGDACPNGVPSEVPSRCETCCRNLVLGYNCHPQKILLTLYPFFFNEPPNSNPTPSPPMLKRDRTPEP
jgi:hypothetical protein